MKESLGSAVPERVRRTLVSRRSGLLLFLTPVLALLVGVGIAWALSGAGHTRQDFYHGIFGGASCTSSMQHCPIEAYVQDQDGTGPNAFVDAAVRHLRDDGGYNEQCRDSRGNAFTAWCWGPNGTGSTPCRKYAFTQAFDPQSDMPWHRMNPYGCDTTLDP